MSGFQKNIQEWVATDNKIKTLNSQLKNLRTNRNFLTENIFSYAQTNNLESAVIEISDGKLKFQNYKQTSPLTYKYVKQCLNECIGNEETVERLLSYMKEKRESRYVNDIKRSYT
jgi:hypothetical protein